MRLRRMLLDAGRGVDVQAWVLLLPLGPSVLEPNLHLSLRQAELKGEVEPLADGQVPGGLELVLQSHELLVGEGRPGSPRLTPTSAAGTGT